jgi:hypothetical protein
MAMRADGECHATVCDPRCNVPDCFFASNYFFALPMTEIVGLVFPTAGKMLKELKVKDEVGGSLVREGLAG